jgi:hypothetical protein
MMLPAKVSRVNGFRIWVETSEKSPRRIFSVGTDTIGLVCSSCRMPSQALMKNVRLYPW